MKALLITIGFALITDLFIYFLLKWNNPQIRFKNQFYWIVNFLIIVLLFTPAIIVGEPGLDSKIYRFYFFWFACYLLIYLPKILFLFFLLVSFSFSFLKNKIIKKYIIYVGIVACSVLFIFIVYGILIGKNNVKVYTQKLAFSNLPKSFDGLKIVQLSDIHLGSFYDTTTISKSINEINIIHPDIIVMTGDMVNILSDEAIPYIPIFKRLHAKYGIYAILGNHDMRDYRKFDSVKAKLEDINKLVKIEQKMGFVVLLDSNIIIRNGTDSIVILGVKNWGLHPFKQHGNLAKALIGIQAIPFKVLLTHDPTHWRAQVLHKTDIALTLTGHTHGMQFGIRNKFFQWSPSKYKYPEYMGLYKQNNQYVYVNVGLGFIGFAGRVGINPEITVITLYSK